MKRVIAIITLIGLLLTTGCAADNREEPTLKTPVLTARAAAALKKVPVYITYVRTTNSAEADALKPEIEKTLEGIHVPLDKRAAMQYPILQDTDKHRIEGLNTEQVKMLMKNPLFIPALERLGALLAGGAHVDKINIHVPETAIGMFDTDAQDRNTDDPYLTNSFYLGYRGRYIFRHMDVGYNLTFDEVDIGDLAGTIQWPTLLHSVVRFVADQYVEDALYSTITLFEDIISSAMDNYTSPLTVSYTAADLGYLRGTVCGTHYFRTVCIHDVDDRVAGHTYYPWSTIEYARLYLDLVAHYPIGRTSGGAYYYEHNAWTATEQEHGTRGYYDKIALFDDIIESYENPIGYFTVDESIDIVDAALQLLTA